MKRARSLSLVLAIAAPAVVVACGGPPDPQFVATMPSASASASSSSIVVVGGHGPAKPSVDEAVLDKSVNPCDDFYAYACGGWRKATPIPDDQSRWNRSFSVLRQKNEEALKTILEDFAAGKNGDAPYAKALGDFYGSCMDEAGIETKALAPLQPELKRIDGVHNAASLTKELAHLHTLGVAAIFDVGSTQDAKDSSQVTGEIVQAGLGMPDRDYYLEEKKKDVKAKYQTFMETIFTLLGDSPKVATKNAATVMAIETSLATASMSRIDRRDPKKTYNRLDRTGLEQKAPQFAWKAYLAELGAPELTAINVGQPDFMKAASDMVKSVPMADWRTYLRFHVTRRAAPALGSKFVTASFTFQQALSGAKVIEPRWKRCVRAVDGYMGEALGQTFVKQAIGADGKAVVKHMVDNLQASMAREIDSVAWMDDATRVQAREKLSTFTKKIAFPDAWRDYSSMKIDRGNYLSNRSIGENFEMHRQLAKIGKPVDRTEWEMTPPTINAYYRADNNEIVFPAGILQAPFYSASMTRAMNYGAIGGVMGHEITHGFDDKGREFDSKGNLRDWWSPTVNAEFEKRASCVEKQFDSFIAIDDIHLKGKLTEGENIADLGGVKVAYQAFKKAQSEEPSNDEYEYSEDQQFFFGFAQVWCENVRDEEIRLRATTDPHSPGRYRVNGPFSNLPEFAKAFSCKDGSAMVRSQADRCEVW